MTFRAAMLVLGLCVWSGAAAAYQDPAPPRPSSAPPSPPKAAGSPSSVDADGFPSDRMGMLRITTPPPLSTGSGVHGYTTYRFGVYNGSDSAQTVRLVLRGKSTDGFHLREVAQSKKIPAKERTWFTLMHPRLTIIKRRVEVWLDGKKLGKIKPPGHYRTLYEKQFKQINVLVGRRVSSSLGRDARRVLGRFRRYNRLTRRRVLRRFRYRRYRWRWRSRWRYSFGRHGSSGLGLGGTSPPAPRLSPEIRALLRLRPKPFLKDQYHWHRSKLSARHWPRQWLAYTPYEGVLITPSEWSAMAAPTRTALRRYVEAGGALVVTGRWTPPKGWHKTKTVASWHRYEPGFGVALAIHDDQTLPPSWKADVWGPVLETLHRGLDPWRVVFDPADADRSFSVVGQLKVPVRGIFSLMLLFVFLIGPLNFWLLKRIDRRLWSLWTIPAMAFVTCVLLFLYASFSEGWGGHARSLSVTYLDQTHKRAATIGWMGFYLPLTPSEGLRFSADTELIPQLANDGRDNRGLSMGLSSGQWLRKGWSLARLPLHLRFRRSERRQERLVVSAESDGRITVTNALGAKIERLWLLDAKGRRFEANDLGAGDRKQIKVLASIPTYSSSTMRDLYIKPWQNFIVGVTERPWHYLKRGHYIAEIKAPIFADAAVKRRSNIRALTVVYGKLGGGDGG